MSRRLSLQTSSYMMAAWKVTGKDQFPVETAAARARLDLEVLERWIRFLEKEPKHYPFVVPWREMIAAEGGSEVGTMPESRLITFRKLVTTLKYCDAGSWAT